MAKLKYAYPIEEVHGKLKGKFGAAIRKQANAKGNREAFSVNYGTRTSDPSADETAARTRFGAIAALVGARRKNVAQRSSDQTAFKAQSTYPTLTKYLWHICTQTYEASLEND